MSRDKYTKRFKRDARPSQDLLDQLEAKRIRAEFLRQWFQEMSSQGIGIEEMAKRLGVTFNYLHVLTLAYDGSQKTRYEYTTPNILTLVRMASRLGLTVRVELERREWRPL